METAQPEPRGRAEVDPRRRTGRAVAFAHNHGVLHRDLKPSNILWDDADGPQVTDFGLAKLLDEVDGSLTVSARVFGSPNYMAPEQAGGRNAELTTATEVANRRLAGELRRVKWQQAEEAIAAGRTPDAMDTFARFLRETPDDTDVAARLRSLLETRAFPLPLVPPLRHDSPVRLIRLAPDGKRLVTVADDGVLRSWHPATGAFEKEARLNLRPESGYLQFLPDGRHLLAARKDGRVIVWDHDRWEVVRELGQSPTRHARLTLGSDGDHVALVTPRDDVELWSASTGRLLARTNLPAKDLFVSASLGTGGEMIICGEGVGMWLWKPAVNHLSPLLGETRKFVFVACDWERRRAYVSLEDQDRKTQGIVCLDLDTREELVRDDTGTAWHTLEVSPDGSHLLASQWGGGIMALESATLREQFPKCTFSPVCPNPATDRSFRMAIRVLHDGSGLLHDLRDGRTLLEPVQHEGLINSHQLSPDGGRLAVAGNHQIRIHDPATGVLLAPPMTELEHVPFVAFSQDGRFLTSARSDTAVRIIDGTNGTPLLLNRAHTIRVCHPLRQAAVLDPRHLPGHFHRPPRLLRILRRLPDQPFRVTGFPNTTPTTNPSHGLSNRPCRMAPHLA
jgi:WD40 repeat protein